MIFCNSIYLWLSMTILTVQLRNYQIYDNQLIMDSSDKNEKVSFYSLKCGIASFIATYIAGVVHPLDVIKTRLQSHDGQTIKSNIVPRYHGIFNALKNIYRYEGIRGLYKGFYISIFSQAAATSFFFWLYQLRKSSYESQGIEKMTAVSYASIEASIVATLLTQPLWVIKTRMLLNIQPGIKQLQNFFFTIKQVYQQNGLAGFNKGLQLSMILSFSGFIQMYTYEGSKKAYQFLQVPQTHFSEIHFICGSISKTLSVLITYPITTIRTRIQQNQFVEGEPQQKYKSVYDVTRKTFKRQGFYGFYKGLTANILKGFPQRGLYFYFYELLKSAVFGVKAQKSHEKD